MYFLFTIVVVILLSLGVLGIMLWIFQCAKVDKHFTELSNETGKLIKTGGNIVKILFNSSLGHYTDNGSWVTGSQYLGILFSLTGRIFFGISPIYEVFHFKTSWNEYAQGRETEDGRPATPSVRKVTEDGTEFKEIYTHDVVILGAEMAREGGDDKHVRDPEDSVADDNTDSKDTSTTKTDAVVRLTYRMTNIIKAIYKLKPEGIVFTEADTGVMAAFNDYVRNRKWGDFRAEKKLDQKSPFVLHIKNAVDHILSDLDIGMEVSLVELRYHELTRSPENEALEESQTMLATARNKGEAEKALAQKEAEAAATRGKGRADELAAVVAVVGVAGAVQLAAIDGLAKTEIRVYGEPTKSTAVVNVGDGDKK